ncbi:Orange carotenoid protein [Pseudanabaenaceae cyanobacterium LEGE 13415]|nr:Orange carotenoid protein [Pseudanabaenaceae cyanobacterium LEGE 13415]
MPEIHSENTQRALSMFQQYDIDTQLALLWYGYLDIKDELNPAPPPTADNLARIIYGEIKALPQDEQLQVQRDILTGADSQMSRSYSAMSNSARIEVWLLLGQGMESGEIINIPSDYKLPEQTHEFSDFISGLSFEERVEFMQVAVQQMGAASKTA